MRFCLLLLFWPLIYAGNAATYHVGKDQTFSSIKDALHAALDGDTVIVHQGQ